LKNALIYKKVNLETEIADLGQDKTDEEEKMKNNKAASKMKLTTKTRSHPTVTGSLAHSTRDQRPEKQNWMASREPRNISWVRFQTSHPSSRKLRHLTTELLQRSSF